MKIADNSQWVEDQFSGCQLGDKRRTTRLQNVARNMLANPEQSLTAQNERWADVKAAYRLFDCDDVTYDSIASAHWENTRQTKPGTYLLISDTTDIDHFSHKATKGLGMLGSGVGRGLQQHSCLMFDSGRKQIVGQAGGTLHKRKRVLKNETRKQRLERFRESSLWGAVVDQVGSPPEGSQWIHVFDAYGDNFEAMCHVAQNHCDFVIRAAKFHRTVCDQQGEAVALDDALKDAEILGSYDLFIRSRQGVKSRTAKIEVSATTVTFSAPRICSSWVKQCGVADIKVNAVVVSEVGAPKGVKPIRWVLLTTLPISSFEDAWKVIEHYEHRWLIEEYHKVLKTGCSLERHALRDASRLEPLIGLIGVIGTRLLQLKLLGRHDQEAKARTHIPSGWLRAMKLARPKIQLTGMTVYQFIRELAKMGGFLGRKSDGEPGWQTIWRGYRKLQSLLDAMKLTANT